MSEKPIKTRTDIHIIDGDEEGETTYNCYAHPRVFSKEWDNILPEHQVIIDAQDGLACEGYGAPQYDCWKCHYNKPRGYGENNE